VTLEQLIGQYGYAAVAAGTLLEGETILVLGGLAAHLGYLDLAGVMAAGFAGGFTGDQVLFRLGRSHGPRVLARRPAWRPRAERVLALLERNQTLLILGFRFLYGLRTVTPFALGMSRVSALRFLPLNAVAAGVWAVAVAGAGYLFGQAAEALLGELRHYGRALLGGVALAGGLLWLARRLRRRSTPPPGAPRR
jgi:membrane protein DedA with SNARE-associated domain